MAKRVLITGAAGFIGSHLAARCVALGHDVHVVVRRPTEFPRLVAIADQLTIHRLDLADGDAVRCALRRAEPEVIFHLGGQTRDASRSAADMLQAVRGDLANLLLLLDAAAQVPTRRFIRAGSLAEYGYGPRPAVEGQRERPANSYAAGMAAGTAALEMLAPTLPFRSVTARLGLVYGPGQSDRFLIPMLIERLLAGRPARVEWPERRRDLMHVEDAVDALLMLMSASRYPAAMVNCGSGHAPTMREVAKLVLAATGADPALVTWGDHADDAGANDLHLCPDLARTQLGWQAKAPLAVGIERTVEAFRATMPQRQAA